MNGLESKNNSNKNREISSIYFNNYLDTVKLSKKQPVRSMAFELKRVLIAALLTQLA